MSQATEEQPRAHRAGAFDVRNVIAALIGFYGVVLLVMGLVADPSRQDAKTGGVNANLWTGIVMVLVALAFVIWSRVRPVVVDERAARPSGGRRGH
jgi:hypothetical protein